MKKHTIRKNHTPEELEKLCRAFVAAQTVTEDEDDAVVDKRIDAADMALAEADVLFEDRGDARGWKDLRDDFDDMQAYLRRNAGRTLFHLSLDDYDFYAFYDAKGA